MSLDPSARVPALSYFFPAHNEEANLEALVEEALAALPALADRFEIIAVDDGSRDATPAIADRLAAAHPDVVRAVHHTTNLGYGAALRSGFRAARYDLVCFTDGDRQFRVADLGRLIDRLGDADAPDVVVGHRIRRADPPIRTIYARLYKLANRVWFGLRVRDVDCACKLFRRAALEGVRVESGRRLLLGRAAHQAARRRADARRGGGAPLPADGRLPDGRPPVGDLARGEGLLGPAAPHVVEPGSRTAPGRGDRGGRARGLTVRGAYCERRSLAGPARPRLGVERVHEVAEDREALLVDRLVVVPVALHAGAVEDLLRGEDAHARPHGERQGVGRPRVDLDDPASRSPA